MQILPQGYTAAGLRAGIASDPRKLDLALFFSAVPAAAAAVFTANRVQAAPVLVSKSRAARGAAQAIVANSGCANACTGARGLRAAAAMARAAGRALAIPEESVWVASTGVIGKFLPSAKVAAGVARLARELGGLRALPPHDPRRARGAADAVRAILTTDTVPKTSARSLRFGGKAYRIWGCAKGAGMIHPDMATLLSFVLTDADVPPPFLRACLRSAVGRTFNALSVDGDTSTNDCVFLLANGASGCRPSSARERARFARALEAVCFDLARQIADDGEGATRRIEIAVTGAPSDAAAARVARTVATSPLVKTAVYGRDANWGRVVAAVGRSGIAVDPGRVRVAFGGMTVARGGCAVRFSEARARRILSGKSVAIDIGLGLGRGRARYLTCDFSLDYVKINADYRT